MRWWHGASGYVVCLDQGEQVLDSLGAFVREQGLAGASFSGIGSVRNVVLGYYDLREKQYVRRTLSGELELISFTGNLAWADDAPVIHAHVALCAADFQCFGGHLFAAEIAVTGEFFIIPTEVRIKRALDARTGLKLMEGGTWK